MKNNEKNRVKLAREVVASWSMDELVTFAEHFLIEHYRASPYSFDEEWAEFIEEEEEEEEEESVDILLTT